jgi:hypothetical protein
LGALISERAACDQGAAITRVVAPDLILLAGDAAQDRGVAQLAQLAKGAPRAPVLVICAPDHAASMPQATARHVALLTPEGGVAECARRVRAAIELFVEEGLAHCSFQQLVDTVAPSTKLAPSSTATAAQAEPVSVTQPTSASVAKPAALHNAPTPTQSAELPLAAAPKAAAVAATAPATAAAAPAQAPKQPAARPTISNEQPTRPKGTPLAAAPTAPLAVPRAEPVAITPSSKQSLTLSTSNLVMSAPTPQAASVAKAETSLPVDKAAVASAAASISKKLAAATAQPQGAQAPNRRTVVGVAPPGTPAKLAETAAAPAQLQVAQPTSPRAVLAGTPPSAAAKPTVANEVAVAPAKRPTLAAATQVPAPAPGKPSSAEAREPASRNDAPRAGHPVETKPERQVAAAQAGKAPSGGSAQTAAVKLDAARSVAVRTPSAPRAGGNSPTVETKLDDSRSVPVLVASAPKTVTPTPAVETKLDDSRAVPVLTASAPKAVTPTPAVETKLDDSRAMPVVTASAPKAVTPSPTFETKLDDSRAMPVLTPHSPQVAKAQPALATPEASSSTALQPTSSTLAATATLAEQPVAAALGARPARPREAEASSTAAIPRSETVSVAPDAFVVSLSARPTHAPEAPASNNDAILLEPSASNSLSDRPTTPPELRTSLPVVSAQPLVAAAREPATAARSPFASPVKAAASEAEILVSFSEPAPTSAAQRSPAKTPVSARESAATPPRLQRRAAHPFEPAPALAPRADASPGWNKPAPQTSLASTAVVEPDIAVSFSEPPSTAPTAAAGSTATAARPPRLRRRAGNPFDAAPMQPQLATPARKDVGAQSSPALRTMPLPTEASAAEVALSSTRPRSRLGRTLLLAGVAAVGCGLILFQLLRGTPANPGAGVAALGALQQATPAPAAAVAIDDAAVVPAAAAQRPPETTSGSPVKPTAAGAPANRPSSAHRDGLEQPTPSEPGSAQQLVDEGLVLFKNGRLGLAEASYLKALKLQPGYPRAMAALVRVHVQRRDGAEAVRWAKQLVDKQPDNGVNQLLLGDALQLRGDLGGAQDAWTEAARLGNATARERL